MKFVRPLRKVAARPPVRRGGVAAMATVVCVGLLAAYPASFKPSVHPTVHQGSVVGRYVLRSVNGQPLPVTLPGEDPRHTIQVTDGVLELRADGSYMCRTVAATSHLGLKETFADTLAGGYTVLQAGEIQFGHKGLKADTIVTSGFQITWTHPVRTAMAAFLYSR